MIYVMSDIHGNLRRFRSVMEQIGLRPEDTLYVLGDVMDRYPDGPAILLELMRTPNARLLLGNHDYMMLCVMDAQTVRSLDLIERYKARTRWYRNGGGVTEEALRALDAETLQGLLDYVRGLPLFYRVELNGQRYRLIHAAPIELYEALGQRYHNETEFAVWHRWGMEDPLPFETDEIFVFGHTPTSYFDEAQDPLRICIRGRRIGIDCGAGFPADAHACGLPNGRLACLRLDDMREFHSED